MTDHHDHQNQTSEAAAAAGPESTEISNTAAVSVARLVEPVGAVPP